MAEGFGLLMRHARDWFEDGRAAGWLGPAEQARFAQVEQALPADLFADDAARPLVVAFFGGTGVGKSSLLNRLAGAPIARVGVERPTSHEVTLYLHESVELAALPAGAPLDSVPLSRHSLPERRGVLWIDAPDIDSVQQANRELALRWLPHVDLLIYVVSPERYRDDVGWRVLRQRGHKHGWMFVLNHWDTGDARQADDFAEMLRGAGFQDPLLLCTSCAAPPRGRERDDFERIETHINDLLARHGLRELERLGQRARLAELRGAVQAAMSPLGDEARWQAVREQWSQRWEHATSTLLDGAQWTIRTVAARFAAREGAFGGALLRQAARLAKGPSEAPRGEVASEANGAAQSLADATQVADALWDDWMQAKAQEAVDALEVDLRRQEVEPQPAVERLSAELEGCGPRISRIVQDRVRAALARPGSRSQRAARRVTGFLMVAAPGLAIFWVAGVAIWRYYRGAVGTEDFLGSNFAIHSALLVLLAWLGPFVADRALRPSLERIAAQAMRAGLEDGLHALGENLSATLDETSRDALARRAAAGDLILKTSTVVRGPLDAHESPIARFVARSA